MNESRLVVVVTGMSGAGRSTALRALDDLSFYTIDNLPTPLIEQAVSLWRKPGEDLRMAVGLDVRVRGYLDEASGAIAALRAAGDTVHVIFLDAADEALVRRFSESRRPHPMTSLHPGADLLTLIHLERERLGPLRELAERVIDTTRLNVHDLRRYLIEHFQGTVGTNLKMTTRVVSFGFKYGIPVDADTVFDVRYLPNPHFVPELRPRTGKEADVSAFVLEKNEGRELLEALDAFLSPLLPRYAREGKVALTVGIGCTGGRHRSVAIAEALGERLRARGAPGDVVVTHRDIERGG